MKKINKLEYALRVAVTKFDLETEAECEKMHKESKSHSYLMGDDYIYAYKLMRDDLREKLIMQVVNDFYKGYQRVHSKLNKNK